MKGCCSAKADQHADARERHLSARSGRSSDLKALHPSGSSRVKLV